MIKYRTEIDLSTCQVGNVGDVMDRARETGEAHLIGDGSKLAVTWEVGDEAIPDMWDLRDIVEELEANLSGYASDFTINKPVPVLS